MNATSPRLTGLQNPETALESSPPAYDQVVPSKSGLVRLVTEQLRHIKLHQGDEEARECVTALFDRLISEYPGVATIEEPVCITRAQGVSHEDFLKRFILKVTHNSPLLKFQEVNSRDELEKSGHFLTHYYDVDNCVDIKICKIPEVIKSVKKLVGKYDYSWISKIRDEPMNGRHYWGKYSGLLENDFFISAEAVDMGNLPHERVIELLLQANASTSYSPLYFFRNDDSLHKGMLIICTSTDPDPNRGMGITIKSISNTP